MTTNVTFRMDPDLKAQMAAICTQIGITPSAAFNIFANAFVRSKGMPFPVSVQNPPADIPQDQMLADADQLLSDFSEDYRRMAE